MDDVHNFNWHINMKQSEINYLEQKPHIRMYTFKRKQINQLQRERVGIKKTALCSQPMFAAMLVLSPVNELCLRMIYT